MRYFMLPFIVIWPFALFGAESEKTPYSREEAFDITTKALLKEESVVILVKNSERIVWNNLSKVGLDEHIVRPVATVAAPLIIGKVSTKGLHFHWEPAKNVKVRPDLDYYLSSGQYAYYLNLNWGF